MEAVAELIDLAKQYAVWEYAKVVLTDERFPVWSGSAKPEHHHYGDGGLAQHTLEVAELCLSTHKAYQKYRKLVRPDFLLLAAIFHDCGKMWDYTTIDGVWGSADHKYRIHHISRSAIVWNERAYSINCSPISSDSDVDLITHAILSHHGCRAWGSPVSPRTTTAWILHCCDQMSARLYECVD